MARNSNFFGHLHWDNAGDTGDTQMMSSTSEKDTHILVLGGILQHILHLLLIREIPAYNGCRKTLGKRLTSIQAGTMALQSVLSLRRVVCLCTSATRCWTECRCMHGGQQREPNSCLSLSRRGVQSVQFVHMQSSLMNK